MRRILTILFAACICAFLPATVRADAEIHLRDGSKIKGQITDESTLGITLAAKKEIVPAADIVDVVHEVEPLSAQVNAYKPAVLAEKNYLDPTKEAQRLTYLGDALNKYKDALKRIDAGQLPAQRQIEYKIAYLMSREAREGAGQPQFALLQLRDFKEKHPNSWQLTECLKNLADMYLAIKNYSKAEETYQELAAANVDAETKQEAELLSAQISIRSGNPDVAQKRLQALVAKLPKNSPVASRAQIAMAETMLATKKTDQGRQLLQAIIKGSQDGEMKARAYNTLGKSYFDAGQLKEARWEFLWVDAMYNQNADEHAKALYHLWQIFSTLGEQERALECRDLLLNSRAFLGSEYQRLAKEKSG